MRTTTKVFGTDHSDKTAVVLLHKQTISFSDCSHITFSEHLALSLIPSALSQITYTLL